MTEINILVKLVKEDLVPLPEDVLELPWKGIVSHNYWPGPTEDDVNLILNKLPDK